MEARPQATFIPKKPVTSIDVGNKGLGFLSLIALIIFLSATIGAGGVYLYKQTLIKVVDQRKQQLEDSKKAFDPEFISFVVRLNKRIEAGKQLLNKHVAVSSVFKLLQESTLQTVQFNTFSFTGTQSGNAPALKLTLAGAAKDYNSLAAQADYFGKKKQIRDQIFSNFSLTQEGRVSFNFDAIVDPTLIDYKVRGADTGSDFQNLIDQVDVSAGTTTKQVATTTSTTKVSTTTNTTRP